jgi:uncharacterized protein YndB with AHSA1/START domain
VYPFALKSYFNAENKKTRKTGKDPEMSPSNRMERTELIFIRDIEASQDQVWKAWTEPEHFAHWWGPKVFTAPLIRIDLREGGKYLWCMRSPEGQDFCNTGVFQEIVPMKRIVCTQQFADSNGTVVPASQFGLPGEWPPEIVVTVVFKPLDKRRTRITVCEAGIPEEMRGSAGTGMDESLDKLVAYLEKDSGTRLISEPGKQEILITRNSMHRGSSCSGHQRIPHSFRNGGDRNA